MAYHTALTLADACHRRMRSGRTRRSETPPDLTREASRFSAASNTGSHAQNAGYRGDVIIHCPQSAGTQTRPGYLEADLAERHDGGPTPWQSHAQSHTCPCTSVHRGLR